MNTIIQLLEPGEHDLPLSRILHSIDTSMLSLSWSQMKLDNSVHFACSHILKSFYFCIFYVYLYNLVILCLYILYIMFIYSLLIRCIGYGFCWLVPETLLNSACLELFLDRSIPLLYHVMA